MRRVDFDYSQPGAYFVTVCTRNRETLLGQIVDDICILSDYGKYVQEEWDHLSQRFLLENNDYCVMPDHVHGILHIGEGMGEGEDNHRMNHNLWAGASPAPTLGTVIGAFKSLSDRRCRTHFLRENPQRRFGRLWQGRFHDHIIRDERDLQKIRQYIRDHPPVGTGLAPVQTSRTTHRRNIGI